MPEYLYLRFMRICYVEISDVITCSFSPQAPPSDAPVVDTAEQVYISSLALLKV